MEMKSTRVSGPDTIDGGRRGALKPRKGSGPRPSRHIPWHEIFKHHISLIEGHLKMADMVRKHTVDGTGDWRAIIDIINRTNEMLLAAKTTAQTFVPPVNDQDQVPAGSSSASMYPESSPADHAYGKAAEQHGTFAAAARVQGVDIKHPDLEYDIGRARGAKRKKLEEIHDITSVQYGSPDIHGAGEASEEPKSTPATPNNLHLKNLATAKNTTEDPVANDQNLGSVTDVNPTSVNSTGSTIRSPKRSASPPEPLEQKKAKKAKRKHDGDLQQAADIPGVEFEDISQEVDARLKEKEEKRKRKEAKKRKRALTDSANAPVESSAAIEAEAPKKKKSKKSEDNVLVDRSISMKRHSADNDGSEGEVKKKKRKKSQGQIEI